jgi:hypothetical protein
MENYKKNDTNICGITINLVPLCACEINISKCTGCSTS